MHLAALAKHMFRINWVKLFILFGSFFLKKSSLLHNAPVIMYARGGVLYRNTAFANSTNIIVMIYTSCVLLRLQSVHFYYTCIWRLLQKSKLSSVYYHDALRPLPFCVLQRVIHSPAFQLLSKSEMHIFAFVGAPPNLGIQIVLKNKHCDLKKTRLVYIHTHILHLITIPFI